MPCRKGKAVEVLYLFAVRIFNDLIIFVSESDSFYRVKRFFVLKFLTDLKDSVFGFASDDDVKFRAFFKRLFSCKGKMRTAGNG